MEETKFADKDYAFIEEEDNPSEKVFTLKEEKDDVNIDGIGD